MGCNCGGKCTDCKKIKAKDLPSKFCDPAYSGDVKYDGTVFTCAADTTLSLAQGDLLNDIILNHATALCSMTTSIFICYWINFTAVIL